MSNKNQTSMPHLSPSNIMELLGEETVERISSIVDDWVKANSTKEPTEEQLAAIRDMNVDGEYRMRLLTILDSMFAGMTATNWDPDACKGIMSMVMNGSLEAIRDHARKLEKFEMESRGIDLDSFVKKRAEVGEEIKGLVAKVTEESDINTPSPASTNHIVH